jgi:hypothetical protein
MRRVCAGALFLVLLATLDHTGETHLFLLSGLSENPEWNTGCHHSIGTSNSCAQL